MISGVSPRSLLWTGRAARPARSLLISPTASSVPVALVGGVGECELLDGLLNGAEHRLGVANDVGEVAVVPGDAFVDALLNGVGVEVVGDPDLAVPGPDAVNPADALFDTHQIPRHVIVDQPPCCLEVESLAH